MNEGREEERSFDSKSTSNGNPLWRPTPLAGETTVRGEDTKNT